MKPLYRLAVMVLVSAFAGDMKAAGPLEGMRAGTVVFEEDFEDQAAVRGNLERWRGGGPAWTVRPGAAHGLMQCDTEPLTRMAMCRGGDRWTDYSILCRIRVVRWGGQNLTIDRAGGLHRTSMWGVSIRTADARNYYRLEYATWARFEGTNKRLVYRLVRYSDGRPVVLAAVPAMFHSSADHYVRMEARGRSIRARVWQAGTPEPGGWTISAEDSLLAAGGAGFLTNNLSMVFGELEVRGSDGSLLLEDDFSPTTENTPDRWKIFSGSWQRAPWGRSLAKNNARASKPLAPDALLRAPAAVSARFSLSAGGGRLAFVLKEENSERSLGMLVLDSRSGVRLAAADAEPLENRLEMRENVPYLLRFEVGEDGGFAYSLREDGPDPVLVAQGEASLPGPLDSRAFGVSLDGSSRNAALDCLELESTTAADSALRHYLRHICDWYMGLELDSGLPKAGTGAPEIFLSSYCARTLLAAGRLLDEPAYVEEAMRWADFVTGSPSILVPLITGTGREGVGLRTYRDISTCVNMGDIGSVMLGIGIICPHASRQRQRQYLDIMEKFSLYVLEGCQEDPQNLGRGGNPDGWRILEGPDKGAFGNGYWAMKRWDEPWDISTTNAGMQFYAVLHGLTGDDNYRRIMDEATDWYLRKEVFTGRCFEMYHDVIYGGEALLTARCYTEDEDLRNRIDRGLAEISDWIAARQNPDSTWNQPETPRNNRTNLVWSLLNHRCCQAPEDTKAREALRRTVRHHLDRRNSRDSGVCESLRKTCFTGIAVAELLEPGITVQLPGYGQ